MEEESAPHVNVKPARLMSVKRLTQNIIDGLNKLPMFSDTVRKGVGEPEKENLTNMSSL